MAGLVRNPNRLFIGVRAWMRRYLILDLVGSLFGLVVGSLVHGWTGRADAMVAAVIVAENVGFYGAAFVRDRVGSDLGATTVLRGLVAEFALAELLDFTLIRPLALVAATHLTGSAVSGIIIGGSVADAVYYLIASAALWPRARRHFDLPQHRSGDNHPFRTAA